MEWIFKTGIPVVENNTEVPESTKNDLAPPLLVPS